MDFEINKMNGELISYIKGCQERGYSPNQIRDTLLAANYPAGIVEEHMQHLSKNTKSENKIKTLIVALIALITLIIAVFYYLRMLK